jgi:glycosyltransferase involved in cell wall biosynthesis/Flp pilus assembly protein TadD
MAARRILTFNFHEPYLHMLAGTGHTFTVGTFEQPPLNRPWLSQFRPLPPNMTLEPEQRWRSDLEAGNFDLLIAHNENNAAAVYETDVPAVLVCHNRRSYMHTTMPADAPDEHEAYNRLLDRLQERFQFVFISESKQQDYNVPGRIIPPGIDTTLFRNGYTGEVAEVLRVGNRMRERDRMFDVGLQERITAGLPNRVVGDNPTLPGAQPAASLEELLALYHRLRCYLHVTRDAFEDGYNLAMLEAMACGMPVVSYANVTSPLIDGENGFISGDVPELRERLEELLRDLDTARRIGAKGRETVAERFPYDRFLERWNAVIEDTLATGPRSPLKRERVVPRLSVLMEYSASPVTTGRYFEWALRKDHEVVTAGLRVPEDLLYRWRFPEPAPPYPPHDIDLPLEATYAQLVEHFPRNFEPDLLFYVDSGRQGVPADLDGLNMPKVCYLIDTHVGPEERLRIARHFDFVFLAQRAQVPLFKRAGIRNVHWLPLACSEELHSSVWPQERTLDVAWVGRCMEDATDRRRGLVETVCERFPNSVRAQVYPQTMADLYNRAKIVVNAAVKNDLNMRVFEAMASGALLITDEADGLEDLFTDREHLVIYRSDEDLVSLVEYYLEHDDERERIARAGQALVREKHTYRARAQTLFTHVWEALNTVQGISGEERFHAGGYYRNERPELAAQVPETARRVLDIGCGGGAFGAGLKRRGVAEVVGIEILEQAHALAKQVLDDALLGNIEQMDLPFEDGYFDCITFGDVLEHLIEPQTVLRKLARVLAPDGVMVASIPNARFCQVVSMLAHGRWEYVDAGILDRTHLRFFTRIEMVKLFRDAGLEVKALGALSMLDPTQLERDTNDFIHMDKLTYGPVDDAEFRDLLTYQYLILAAKPHADPLLPARKDFEQGDYDRAIEEAEKVVAADAVARYTLVGKACAALKRFAEAEGAYCEALKLAVADTEALQGLIMALTAQERAEEAGSFIDRALQALPEDARLLDLAAQAALARGDRRRALEAFFASLDQNFDQERVLDECARLGAELNRLEEVAPHMRRFVDFYPAKSNIAAAFVRVLKTLEETEEAEQRLDTLLMFFPDEPEVQALLQELEQEDDEIGG